MDMDGPQTATWPWAPPAASCQMVAELDRIVDISDRSNHIYIFFVLAIISYQSVSIHIARLVYLMIIIG